MRVILVIVTLFVAQHLAEAKPSQDDFSNTDLRQLVNQGMQEFRSMSNNDRGSIAAGSNPNEYQPQQGHTESSQGYQSEYMPNGGYMQLPREYQNRPVPEGNFDAGYQNSETSHMTPGHENTDGKYEAQHGYAQMQQQEPSQNEYSRPMYNYMSGQQQIPDGYQLVNGNADYGVASGQGGYHPQRTQQDGSNGYQIYNDDSSYKVPSMPSSYSSGYQPQGSYNMNNGIQKQNYAQDGYQIPNKYQEILDKSSQDPITIALPGNDYRFNGYNSNPQINSDGYQVVHEGQGGHVPSYESRPNNRYNYPTSGQQRGSSVNSPVEIVPVAVKGQDLLKELGLQLGYDTSNRNPRMASQNQYAYPRAQNKPYGRSFMPQG